ncbi:MAG: efflux RND transporter periplasmic adaptor subunit [Candidatus Competibacteraceae bacterium]|nr:efflux RND transporter periplasmic adaptor subunit [Candidatus Competibacteraceae bacterium]
MNNTISLARQLLISTGILLLLGTAAWYFEWYPGTAADASDQARPNRAVKVIAAQAVTGPVRMRIEAVGSTLARQSVDIVPLAAGRVAEILVTPGQQVTAGDLLIRLDDTSEQASVDEAKARLQEAKLALERMQRLRSNNTIAQSSVDEAQAAFTAAQAQLARAQQSLRERAIKAPFSGVLGLLQVDIGARIDSDDIVTTLDDLGTVEIEFSVPETFFGQLKPDQPITALSAAYPDRLFEGRIAHIDTRVAPSSRAFQVRAIVPNDDLALPAGMFMHVEVVLGERIAVLIPEEAVLAENDKVYVFALVDGKAQRREIQIGLRDANQVEVLQGLHSGELVVRQGLQRLRNGSVVQIVNADEFAPLTAAPPQTETPEAPETLRKSPS